MYNIIAVYKVYSGLSIVYNITTVYKVFISVFLVRHYKYNISTKYCVICTVKDNK